MKTRTEQVVVPEETYTKTTYGCDVCDFEAESEDDVKGHFGKTHASKKESVIGSTTFHWFDSKEDAELFLDPPGDFYSPGDGSDLRWEEPGWYGREYVSHRGGCRCGGCERNYDTLTPLSEFIDRWKKEVESHEKSIKQCLSHIEAAQSLNPKQESQS